MERSMPVEDLDAALSEFSYPIIRDDAAIRLEEVAVTFEDGSSANLGVLVSETESDVFDTVADLREEVAEIARPIVQE